jgi:hypothetical protein
MRTPRPIMGLFFFALALSAMRGLVACGDRTGLLVDERPEAAPDAAPDVVRIRDAAHEDHFVEEDALPPIDVTHKPDVIINDCVDAGSTLIYVVTSENFLYSFYPPTAEFRQIGLLSCPTPDSTWQPFSMAVDRKGTAYVLFTQGFTATSPPGQLYRVSTATAACVAVPYVPGQQGFNRFGMGFVGSPNGRTDTLYVAADNTPAALGTIDVTSFHLSVVGTFAPQDLPSAELSGTGTGQLYAFYSINGMTSSAIAQIDPMTAQVTAQNDLSSLPQQMAWAFAYWGGDFYLFTGATGQPSTVTRYSPSDGSQITYATAPNTIVGAGVSTCAPQQ